MAIDFNTDPYYDDFSESQNYYRILFRPGRAVQARELTQIQSMLQNQIEQMGTNLFKDGTVVKGGQTFVSPSLYLWVTSDVSVETFENKKIIGDTSGAVGIVRKATPATSTYSAAFYLTMVSGQFQRSETVSIEGTNTTATISSDDNFSGPSMLFSIVPSVFYTKGHFVYCPEQTTVVSSQFAARANARIGLEITEGVTTSDDDEALLDPAVGSNNYFAPGADRYFIDLTLKSIEYEADVENSDTTTIEEFIEVANIRRGELISVPLNTQYNELEKVLARRTYDESGDYTVKPFIAKVRDHIFGDNTKLTVEVSPGKAYVKGYEFETIAPSYITMERARDYGNVNGYSISLDYGKYIPVSNVAGFVNASTFDQVDIHRVNVGNVSVASSGAYNATKIGTARIRHIAATGTANVYNLYLANISVNTGNTFSESNSFVIANITAAAKLVVANVYDQGNAALVYGTDDSFLFNTPQKSVKTFKPGGTSDTTYEAFKNISSVSFAPGTGGYSGNSVATLTLTGTETFVGSAGIQSDTFIKERFFAVVTSSSGSPAVGTILDFTGASGEIEYSSTKQNAYLRFVNGNSFSANVVALVSTSSAQSKTKTLTQANVVVSYGTDANTISLGKSDIYNIVSIEDALGNNYLSAYVLDNGQRDDFYDHGSITIKTANTGPILDSVNNPNVKVTFNYFTHTGTTYFDVDSYTGSNVSYGDIPTYKNSYGEVIKLSDVIDFRPVRANDSNYFLTSVVPQPGGSFVGDFEYYLPRKDRLVLTKDRKFTVVKGVPAVSPNLPGDQQDAMNLYNLELPAYTASPADVKLKYVDNKRFTMRDIGKIEKRVDRLEYYTALSFLEKIAADERIPSQIAGIDRFKNGILVDAFAGHSVADVRNGDLSCSIDPISRIMRPRFASETYYYAINGSDSTNYAVSPVRIVTCDYTEVPLISQTKATNTVNVNPFDVFTWTGIVTLTPSTDVWGDTRQNPEVTVNLNGENDAFTQITLEDTGLTPWGTRWDDWRSVFKGVTDVDVSVSSVTTVENEISVDETGAVSVTPTAQTATSTSVSVTTQESFARAGLEFYKAGKTITTNLGNKVIDSSIIPYIRSKPIYFVAKNLKPNTRMYATFDGKDVTGYCFSGYEVQVEASSANVAGNVTVINVYDGATKRAEGNVIYQKGNVFYLDIDTTLLPPVAGNVATLTNSSGTTTSNIVAVDVPNFFDNLRTNEAGDLAGIFVIPNNDELKFNLGERAFKLVDSLDKRFVTTTAETRYLAYGLSQTKEDTILATRMNLVSIKPMLEVKMNDPETTTKDTVYDPGVRTVGSSNEVFVPPPNPPITTMLCGEDFKTSGRRGVNKFKIALGTGVGPFRVRVSPGGSNATGGIPDRFIVTYRGKQYDTGFIMRGSEAKRTEMNERLKKIGREEVRTLLSTAWYDFNFTKLTETPEELELEVDAPLSGTAWRVQVDQCPSGQLVDPTPGRLRATLSDKQLFLTTSDRLYNRGDIMETSAEADVTVKVTLTNTANDPRFTVNGDDKTVRVTSISAAVDGVMINEGLVLSVENTGTSQGVYGTTTYPGKTTETVSNTLGTLPVILQPGESRVFHVRFQKPPKARVGAWVTLTIGAQGPGAGGTRDVPIEWVNSISGGGRRQIEVLTKDDTGKVWHDPLAQTFLVSGRDYPDGVFISSLDLWFRTKDPIFPVQVSIRPTVNGFPSSTEVIPFAYSTKDPSNITAAETFDIDNFTRFTFPSPIYLQPGEYSFVVAANSKEYTLYSSVLGEFQLDDPTLRVTTQPYLGSLFKSQNASAWSPEQNEDITFRLNKCDFDTSVPTSVVLDTVAPVNNVEYDVFFTSGEVLEFTDTAIEYGFKGTSQNTGVLDTNYTNYSSGINYPLSERKILKGSTGNSLKFKTDLVTTNRDISPVIDLERLSSVLIRNIINNDATGEDGASGGNADAKYITRRVTLAPGFEAQTLRVYLNAYLPGSSSIQVYYKVNAPGTVDFDTENNYVLMTATSESGDSRARFAEFTFEPNPSTNDGNCLPDGALFNIFTIKIVMLSDDTTKVPIIRDLRVLALDAE